MRISDWSSDVCSSDLRRRLLRTLVTHGRAFYPEGRIGRGVTVLNTVVLGGATAFQAASGLLIDMAASLAPGNPEIGYRLLFAALALLLVAGLLVYVHAAERPAVEAAPQPLF